MVAPIQGGNQGAAPAKKGGLPTWAIVLIVCVAASPVVIGVVAAIAIYGVRKYITNAKRAEATYVVTLLAKSVAGCATALDETGKPRGLPDSAPAVPGDLAQVSGAKYQSSASDWSAPAYTCSSFVLKDPNIFSMPTEGWTRPTAKCSRSPISTPTERRTRGEASASIARATERAAPWDPSSSSLESAQKTPPIATPRGREVSLATLSTSTSAESEILIITKPITMPPHITPVPAIKRPVSSPPPSPPNEANVSAEPPRIPATTITPPAIRTPERSVYFACSSERPAGIVTASVATGLSPGSRDRTYRCRKRSTPRKAWCTSRDTLPRLPRLSRCARRRSSCCLWNVCPEGLLVSVKRASSA